jgi:ATP-dependent protease ClpP protease subunit
VNKRHKQLVASLEAAITPVFASEERSRTKQLRDIKDVPGLAVRNEGGARELMIYGRIGGGGWFDEGIGASDVASALRELGPGPVDVRINSGGGDVFDGVAIHSLLVRHQGTVTTHIDGLAASAASFIAMAGDNVVMARNAFFMIHDGMTMTYGNGNTHRASGELLDKISDTIADIYAEKAGEDVAHWRNLMTVNGEDGTWYSGQEALDAGLVDEITGAQDGTPDARLLDGWKNVLPERIVAQLPEQPEKEQEQSAWCESCNAEHVVLAEEQACPAPEQEEQPAPEDTIDDAADWAYTMSMWHHLNSGRTAKEGTNA